MNSGLNLERFSPCASGQLTCGEVAATHLRCRVGLRRVLDVAAALRLLLHFQWDWLNLCCVRFISTKKEVMKKLKPERVSQFF